MKIGNNFDRVLDIMAFLSGIIIILSMVCVSADALMRYFFNRPIFWVAETTEIGMLYSTFLGTTWLLRQEGHVKVDILLNHMNSKTVAFLTVISSLVGMFICIALIWFGVSVSWQFTREGLYEPTSLELPKGPLLAIIPVGSFVMLIQFIRRMCVNWKKWKAQG